MHTLALSVSRSLSHSLTHDSTVTPSHQVNLAIKVYVRFLFWTASRTKQYWSVSEYLASHQQYVYDADAECTMYTLEYSPYTNVALDEFNPCRISRPIATPRGTTA